MDSSGDQISVQTLNEFIRAKNIERVCDECGENAWFITSDPDEPSQAAVNSLPNARLNKYIPCYALICSGCGTMKLIFAGTVKEWEKGRG